MDLLPLTVSPHFYFPELVLRGLDVLSTEEGVLQAIQHASTDLPIKSVRIGRDPLTNISRGVCFVELDSVYDAMTLFNKLMSRPPTIDGKQINISYCKLSNSQQPSLGGKGAATNWSGDAQPPAMPQTNDIAELAEYSASLYAKTPEEHEAYVQYYTQYYQQQQEQVCNVLHIMMYIAVNISYHFIVANTY